MLSEWYLLSLLAVTAAVASPCQPINCSVDTALAGAYVNGSVSMVDNPLIHFDGPKTGGFNATVGEDWSFEGAAADGQSAMAFTRESIPESFHTVLRHVSRIETCYA